MQACPLPTHQAMKLCVMKALYSPKCLPGLSPCSSDPAAREALPTLLGCMPWVCEPVLPVEPAPPTGRCPVEPGVQHTLKRAS